MDVFQILEELETTSSSKQKIAILAANKDNMAFVVMLDAALNFQRKFFVKKFNDNSQSFKAKSWTPTYAKKLKQC